MPRGSRSARGAASRESRSAWKGISPATVRSSGGRDYGGGGRIRETVPAENRLRRLSLEILQELLARRGVLAARDNDAPILDRLVPIRLCGRNRLHLPAGQLGVAAIDNAGVDLAALNILQHLSDVQPVDDSRFQLFG